MPQDQNINAKGGAPRAVAGLASVLGGTAAPPIMAGGINGGSIQCDTCRLFLPRSATHIDVVAHPCYRGFTISLTAAGHLSLA